MKYSWVARSLNLLTVLALAASVISSSAVVLADGVGGNGADHNDPDPGGNATGNPHGGDGGGLGSDSDPNEAFFIGEVPGLIGPVLVGCITRAYLADGKTPTIDIFNSTAGYVVTVYLDSQAARDAFYNAGVGRCIEATGTILSSHEFSATGGRVT